MTESLRIEIERALQTLTPREADVIRLYFGLGGQHAMTLEEIGETFDLTRERVPPDQGKSDPPVEAHFPQQDFKNLFRITEKTIR